ncbi:MAG: YbaB/EbfC family nucleoid-associated protein [Elusimicrobia bacterium]|nr:YbaB/EbfC family nucleoid-associated protein [Elusimicrobiota bacterium]
MDMLKMLKEAAAMRSKLGEMEKKMKSIIFETQSGGVTITMNAKSEALSVTIAPELLKKNLPEVEKAVLGAIQQAVKKSHDLMAEEAKTITGGLKIPGLM